MLYPRETHNGRLIDDTQMVGVREHLSNRRIFNIAGEITNEIDSQNILLAMDSLSHKPIKLFITSPGGGLDAAFLLYDTLKMLRSPVITIGRYCASAAVLLLAAGKKRYLLPHAKIMLHLPSGAMMGDSKEWEIQHKQMQIYKDKMVDVLIECGAKKSKKEILLDIDRDFWLDPQEAIEYGLADEILKPSILGEWLK